MFICDISLYSHMFTLNSHWNCIIHIPDHHFLTTRYYGFYANASKKTLDKIHALLKILKNKDYSRETRPKSLKTNSINSNTVLI